MTTGLVSWNTVCIHSQQEVLFAQQPDPAAILQRLIFITNPARVMPQAFLSPITTAAISTIAVPRGDDVKAGYAPAGPRRRTLPALQGGWRRQRHRSCVHVLRLGVWEIWGLRVYDILRLLWGFWGLAFQCSQGAMPHSPGFGVEELRRSWPQTSNDYRHIWNITAVPLAILASRAFMLQDPAG